MKIQYFADTDTLYIDIRDREMLAPICWQATMRMGQLSP